MGFPVLLHGGARTWQAWNRHACPGYHMAVLGLDRHVTKCTQATAWWLWDPATVQTSVLRQLCWHWDTALSPHDNADMRNYSQTSNYWHKDMAGT